jgi:hypothetical protein
MTRLFLSAALVLAVLPFAARSAVAAEELDQRRLGALQMEIEVM